MLRSTVPYTAVISLILIAGCTVGPDYKRPDAPSPNQWASPTTAPSNVPSTQVSVPSTQPATIGLWWKQFNDPTLDRLINQSLRGNLDLRQAAARLREARANRGVTGADLWPDLNASGSYTRSRSAGVARSGSNTVVNTGNSGNGSKGTWQAGFDASWEIDVFGGTRRNVEAADADIAAAIEDSRDVLVSLTAELATNYLDLRSAQQRIAIAKNSVELQRHNADIARKRFNAGFVSGLDLANAEAQMASTSSQIPPLESAARQSMYAISILLGREPGALVSELSPTASIPTTPPAVPVGLPSELLERRPDVRRSEQQLHAATARIGAAKADYFPKFSLTGSLGTQGSKFKDLGNWDNRFWSVGPSVSWPIFDAGRIRANVAVKNAVNEQAILTYTQIVLTALRDVENALIAYSTEQQHREALTNTVIAYRKALDLATRLYTNGQTDYLNVVTAQGSLYNAEDSLVQSDRAVAANLVALYKALGGGWEEVEQSEK